MASIPGKSADIAALGVRVATAWANYPTLTLEWITQLDAASLTTNYNNIILQTSEAKGSERDKVRTMQELDDTINSNIYRLKLLIEMEYGKDNLSSHYADFGIVKQGSSYQVPFDRDDRLQSLRLMVSRLATAPFQANTYGQAYWQNILTQYEAEKTALESQVGRVSTDVVDKQALKEDVVQLLRSIKLLIIANYPQTATGILRDFGYQDERN